MDQKFVVKKISQMLANISQPARILILLAIGEGEACVCHLEALLGYRQAYISQHLMALRTAGLVDARREGRYVFYRLKDARLLALLNEAATLVNVGEAVRGDIVPMAINLKCKCPGCSPSPIRPILNLQETG